MVYDDHDPWNEPSHRHPIASKLMLDETLWDCVNELAPFGSDEGADAYCEFRNWRADNPTADLTACVDWILGGKLKYYDESIADVDTLESSDLSAQSFGYGDAFTLDATIIATILGQLIDEGCIDSAAKPLAFIAISRQSHPKILAEYPEETIANERRCILEAVRKVIEAA